MDSQFPDKAIHYFERAALIQYARLCISKLVDPFHNWSSHFIISRPAAKFKAGSTTMCSVLIAQCVFLSSPFCLQAQPNQLAADGR